MLDTHAQISLTVRLVAAAVAVGAVLATPLLGARPAAAHARVRCAHRAATLLHMGAHQPSCWKPFAPSSPFNTLLPAHPRAARRNALVRQHLRSYRWTLQASSSQSRRGFTLTADAGTRPVYFARPSDPLVTVRCWERYGPTSCPTRDGRPLTTMRIHVPPGVRPASNTDAHMTVVETASRREYDFYDAGYAGGAFSAGVTAIENVLNASGTRAGVSAASFALTAGLLRPSELASGRIGHALVVTVPCTDAEGAHVGYSWPAAGGWGQKCGDYWHERAGSAPAIGQLFQLRMTPAQIRRSRAPRWEQTIMTALARYGAYAEDTNGGGFRNEGMDIVMQDQTNLHQRNQWASVISRLGGRQGTLSSAVPIPVSRLQVVAPCAVRRHCG